MAQAEMLGKLTNVEGHVNIKMEDGTIRAASAGDTISDGQIVLTGSGSSATIEFSNGCEIVLGANEQSLMDKTLLATEGLVPEEVTVAEESVNQIIDQVLGGENLINLESTAAGIEDEGNSDMGSIDLDERRDERGSVESETSQRHESHETDTTPSTGNDSLYESILSSLPQESVPVYEPEADTTAPIAPTLTIADTDYANAGLTNDNTPTFNGTGEPGATIIIYDDYKELEGGRSLAADSRAVLGEAVVDSDGKWTFTPDPLADGKHIISVESMDDAGNRSAAAEIATLIIDTVAPDAPTIDSTEQLDTLALAIAGTAEAGSSVTLNVDGTEYTVTADGDGNWAVTTPVMEEGDHDISATATDAAGNVSDPSAPQSVTVAEPVAEEPTPEEPTPEEPTPEEPTPEEPVVEEPVDTTAPTVTVDPIDITNTDSPTVSGEVDDTDAIVTVSVDGDDTVADVDPETGEWSVTVDGLSEGDHTITVTATDSAGNSSTEDATFTVDLSAPDAPVLDFGGLDLTNSATPTFSGTAEPGSTVTVYDYDDVLGSLVVDESGTFTFTTPALEDGTHVLTAQVTDPAGNVSGTSDPVTIVIDTTAPEVDISTMTIADTDNPTVGGTVNDTHASITVDVDGTQYEATIDPETGEWSASIDPLAEGEHTLSVTATDEAGNSSDPVTTTVTVEAAAEEEPEGDDEPVDNTDDGNNGNGNDDDHDDDSNPGNGSQDDDDDEQPADDGDDHDNGHGNDDDHHDDSNPGHGHHHGGDHHDGHHGHHGILADDDHDRFDFDKLDKEKKEDDHKENGKEEKDRLPDLDDVIQGKDDTLDLGEKHGHGNGKGNSDHGKESTETHAETDSGHGNGCGGHGGYMPSQPDFGLDDTGNHHNS